jgi:hypothetical protein
VEALQSHDDLRTEEEQDVGASPCYLPSPASPLHDDQVEAAGSALTFGSEAAHRDDHVQAARPDRAGIGSTDDASASKLSAPHRPIDSDRPAKILRTEGNVNEEPRAQVATSLVQSPQANNEAQLDDLLALADDGFDVVWPAGWSESLARAHKRERPPLREPAPKKVRVA